MLMQLYASISVTGSQKVKINSKFLIYIFNIFVFFAQGKLSADKHCSIRDFGSFQKKFAYFHLLLEVFFFQETASASVSILQSFNYENSCLSFKCIGIDIPIHLQHLCLDNLVPDLGIQDFSLSIFSLSDVCTRVIGPTMTAGDPSLPHFHFHFYHTFIFPSSILCLISLFIRILPFLLVFFVSFLT